MKKGGNNLKRGKSVIVIVEKNKEKKEWQLQKEVPKILKSGKTVEANREDEFSLAKSRNCPEEKRGCSMGIRGCAHAYKSKVLV